MNDNQEAFIDMHKYLLVLQYQLAEYEMDGFDTPEHLFNKIKVTKKKLKYFCKVHDNRLFPDW